jgi:hypothetical protein
MRVIFLVFAESVVENTLEIRNNVTSLFPPSNLGFPGIEPYNTDEI